MLKSATNAPKLIPTLFKSARKPIYLKPCYGQKTEIQVAYSVRQKLQLSPYPEIRKIEFELEEKRLFLFGQVSKFFYKQLAQETVRNCEGIELITNEIIVSYQFIPQQSNFE